MNSEGIQGTNMDFAFELIQYSSGNIQSENGRQ